MPSTTFESLDAEKKTRIRRALLEEFSQYPLSHAQVARIVQAAHISRGAFYVYFTDLVDSYRWVLHQGLDMIEDDLVAMMRATPDDSLQAFVNYTEHYAAQLKSSPYRALYAMHWQCNESYLSEVEGTKRTDQTVPDEQTGGERHRKVSIGNVPSSDAHRFESITLVVQGRPIADRQITRVVVAMLATLTHQTVKDVLAGEDPTVSMHNYTAAVGIIRDGLIKQQEERSVSGHKGN